MRRLFPKFSIILIRILVMLFILGISTLWFQTAHATNLHPNAACQNNWHYNWIGNVEVATGAYSHCGSTNALAPDDFANCDSAFHNGNADAWQTRQVYPGGTRYNETGRSGFITYPPNCSWYWVQTSYLTSQQQLQDPSYGCAWFAVDVIDSSHTLDYQCALFPNR